MSKDDIPPQAAEHTEYRVVASLEHPATDRATNERTFTEVETDWSLNRERAESLVRTLLDQGHNAEVRVRDRVAYVPQEGDDDC